MALIPGTLPNDTCYGTPQDLLELFAQYLDVPAFALSSKVVFSTTNTGFTSDIVWFDTTSATRPIMKITVSSSGFLDYVKNYITAAPVVTIVGADTLLIADASDSSNTKRGLVSDIVALAVPAAGSITPAQLAQPFTRGTSVTAATTAVDFTGIPSWAKRITVVLDGISTNGTANVQVQVGSGSITATGYTGNGWRANGGGNAGAVNSTGFQLENVVSTGAGAIRYGVSVLTSLTGNTWVFVSEITTGDLGFGTGSIALGGTLDRVRLTTVGGANTFDGGTINIMYE